MMMSLFRALLVAVVGLATRSAAAGVSVAVTVAPVHSLVSMVTEGVSEPALIVRPGASPHGYALKPSEALALDRADVVFWMGEALEPWMTRMIDSLAGDAVVVDLATIEGVRLLDVRDIALWAADARQTNGTGNAIDGEVHGRPDKDRRAGGLQRVQAFDPHVWLDPDNAIVWLRTIPGILAAADPGNAEVYRANGRLAVERIETLTRELDERLTSLRSIPYMVFHDAYQYFEARFGLNPVGAISGGDADRPSAARIALIRDRIRDSKVACVVAEPQFEPRLIDVVIAGSNARKGVLDPIGAGLQPGPDLYPTLMRQMATALVDCLDSSGS